MRNRIIEIRKKLGLSQTEFGSKIGLKCSSLSDIETGKSVVTERTILSICAIYNVSEKWLRYGTGEMFNIVDKKYNEFFSTYKKLNPVLQEYLLDCAKKLIDAQTKLYKE